MLNDPFELTRFADKSNFEIIDHIELINRKIARFWKAAYGWATMEAAGLLSKARLDWQVSLSSSLRLWLREPPDILSEGELILAWTNLGALIEGTLKLFLSVFYHDYQADIEALNKAGAYDHRYQAPKPPDGLTLEPLRKYVKGRDIIGRSGDDLVELVQERRNAIHAFRNRPIGNDIEFWNAVHGYFDVLIDMNERLPYPSDEDIP